MFERIKNYFLRREYQKAIENAFVIAQYTYPEISQEKRKELRQTLTDLLDDYYLTWGLTDGVVEFYRKQLEFYIVIYHN